MAPLLTLLFTLIFLSLKTDTTATPPLRKTTFSVIDYGAIGDKKHYNTPHIQAAIDACHAAGGGVVEFPPGDFLTGTIYLKSGVILDVTENATIYGGTKLSDYPLDSRKWFVVLAENANNVGITGWGTIDGQGGKEGGKFIEKMDGEVAVMVSWNKTGACYGKDCRPKLVGFFDCRNVTISLEEFREPAHWNVQIVRGDNTTIDSSTVEGDFEVPTNQGIYIEDSNNTIIQNFFADNAYHAVSLKTNTGGVHNLTLINSWIRTRSTAIRLETANSFGFKNLLFDNIEIDDSHQGIKLKINDGGTASDITFSNIKINTEYEGLTWWKRAAPIYITSCPRLDAHVNPKLAPSGSVNNLQFINITSHSEDGVFLSGSSEGVLSNLKFINVNFTYDKWDMDSEEGFVNCERRCHGNNDVVCRKPAGITMEHINGLVIENMKMKWNKTSHWKGWDSALEFSPSTVNNITLLGFNSVLIGHE